MANLKLRTVAIDATLFNPYDAKNGKWDYGFSFRNESSGQYRIYVTSDYRWVCVLVRTTDDNTKPEFKTIDSGKITYFNSSASGQNSLRVVVDELDAYLFVNNVFIADIDVSDHRLSGDIWIGTGFEMGDEISGESTYYQGFTVLNLL